MTLLLKVLLCSGLVAMSCYYGAPLFFHFSTTMGIHVQMLNMLLKHCLWRQWTERSFSVKFQMLNSLLKHCLSLGSCAPPLPHLWCQCCLLTSCQHNVTIICHFCILNTSAHILLLLKVLLCYLWCQCCLSTSCQHNVTIICHFCILNTSAHVTLLLSCSNVKFVIETLPVTPIEFQWILCAVSVSNFKC